MGKTKKRASQKLVKVRICVVVEMEYDVWLHAGPSHSRNKILLSVEISFFHWVISWGLRLFRQDQCPDAYAYGFDESSGTALWTCASGLSSDYTIVFCP